MKVTFDFILVCLWVFLVHITTGYVPTISPRIVGGTQALKGEFPFMIGVRRASHQDSGTFTHMCGGVLINASWILTASHCSLGPLSEYLVVAGDHFNEVEEGTEQQRTLLRAVIHPEYNAGTNENDVALMQVSEPFEYNEFVQPAKLSPIGFSPAVGSDLVAAGWGRLEENGEHSPVLMKVEVPFVEDDMCRMLYSQTRIKDNMLCAGTEGKDSCKADSGGPLMCLHNGQVIVCGTSAFGTGCARKDKPGVYAELSFYTEWLSSVVKFYAT